jgi:polysaccharide export outer membrane protein
MPARTPQPAERPPRRGRRALVLGLLLAPCLVGCALAEKHRAKKIPQLGLYDPTQPRELCKVTMPPLVVEPPDELEITARPTGLELPLANFVVRPDGVVDLGYYGEVYVTGLTVPQVELKIAQHLAVAAAQQGADLGHEPIRVSVRLVSHARSKQYYVIGTVNLPGSYPITGNDTVLDAILRAGLLSYSYPDKAYLARPHPAGGPEQLLRIDWERIKQGDTLTNYQLMPGDRIVVPGGRPPGLLQTLAGGR